MTNLRRVVLGGLLAWGAVGCNPEGTCKISAKADDSLGDACIVNYKKRPCLNAFKGEFFEENATAGLARCKGEGYEAVGSSAKPGALTRDLKAGKSVTLYKKRN